MLNWEASMIPSDRMNAVRNWAEQRAKTSARPAEFRAVFERAMEVIAKRGEEAVLDRPPVWQDATRVAAEIEALSARRALTNWGTRKGTYHLRLRLKDPTLAA